MTEKLYVIDPATVIVPQGRDCVIHRLGEENVVATDDAQAAIEILAYFVRPAALRFDPARVLVLDEAAFYDLSSALRRIGVLREHDGESGTPAVDDGQVTMMLMMLARTAEEFAGDIAAMGPDAHRYLEEATGEDLQGAIRDTLGELTRLATLLGGRRDDYVEGQLAGLSEQGKSPRLHLGSGRNRLEGWYNIDFFPAELSLNMRWGLPFDADSIEYVFLAHLFEHFYKRTDAPRLLREIHRVLKPGGVARIIVPDAEFYLQAYVESDAAFFAMQRRVWHTWAPKARTHLEAILGYLGAAESAGNPARHKYGYDFETLKAMLEEASFVAVERSTYMGSTHPVLQVDESSTVAEAQVNGRHASLFVEARK